MNQFNASLWGDEGWAANLAIKSIPSIISIVSRDTSPPLYYLFLHTWMKLFGTSEVAIRALSFSFFLGTVFIVYLIGKQLWNKKTGLIAALLTLTNPFLFSYGFEGRMYSLLALTSTLSIYFLVKKAKIPFVIAATAALYTHHFSIFVVFWEGVWVIATNIKKPLKNIMKECFPFLGILILYLPWIKALYYQTSLVGSGFWLGKPHLKDIGDLFFKFVVGNGKNGLQKIAFFLLSLSILIRLKTKQISKTLFLIGWATSPIMITYLISQFFQSIFFDRYMLVSIPAVMLLVATERKKVSIYLISAAIVFLTIGNIDYFLHPTKRPFRELATYIKLEEPSLPLVNYSGSAHHLWESKYYGLNAPIYSTKELPFFTGTALMTKGDIIDRLPQSPIIGVITSEPVNNVNLPGYKTEKSKSFGSLSLIWISKQ